MGILSTREEFVPDEGGRGEEGDIEGMDEGGGDQDEGKPYKAEKEERRRRRKGGGIPEGGGELVLSLWKWPEGSEGGGVESLVEDGPRRLVMTSVTQMRSHQVTRMSLSRGVPDGVVAVVIVGQYPRIFIV